MLKKTASFGAVAFVVCFFNVNNQALGNCVRLAEYTFEGMFRTKFVSFDEVEELLKKDIVDKDVLLQIGVFYFVKGTGAAVQNTSTKQNIKKASEIFNRLWRMDRNSNRIRILLAYSYAAMASIKDTPLDKVIFYVNRAQKLVNLTINSLPKNIDARLCRLRINISRGKDHNRPDDLLLEDSLLYLEVYQKLDTATQTDLVYLMGLMEARLAAALVYETRQQLFDARRMFFEIDSNYLDTHVKSTYAQLKKKLQIQKGSGCSHE